MSLRGVAMIVLALVCGVAAAVGMNRLRQPAAAGEKAETVPVVVAVAEIGRGRMVQAKDLEVRDWPKDVAPAGRLDDDRDGQGPSSAGAHFTGRGSVRQQAGGQGFGPRLGGPGH